MLPRTASHARTYNPYLTDPDADYGAEVKQNIADGTRPSKTKTPDLQRVIAHIHELGLPLVSAAQLPRRSPRGRS